MASDLTSTEVQRRNDPANPSQHVDQDSSKYSDRLKFLLLFAALCLAVLCQALDNTIIATAIPRITDEFKSLEDVGWYGSAYLLTTCAFQLSYGKLYNLFPIKWVFLVALGIFELGSLVCGAAPNSVGLIMGRAVAGIGSGGIFSGATLIIANSIPLNQRPIYNGVLGGMYAIASVAGPLMGGAFTEYVTWRLCFYINLAFGFLTAIAVFLFMTQKDAGKNPRWSLPLKEKFHSLDVLGLAALVPTIVCLLLALQWGNSKYHWKNVRIIVLFILSGLLFGVFVGLQVWQKDRATVPISVMKRRTIWACSVFSFLIFGSFLAITYYLPIWFQAIKGNTATQSGIHNLPSILGTVILSFVAGGLVFALGYYTWACIIASILASVGAGLLSTLTPESNSAYWIGYQVAYGAGIGFGLQQPLIAVQTALPDYQVSEGTAIIIFVQTFGGSIFISVAQNVFNNKLIENVIAQRIPVDPVSLLSQGATHISSLVDPVYLDRLKSAYNEAITQTFYVSVATAGLSIFGSAFIPWLSVKEKKPKGTFDRNDERQSTEKDAQSGQTSGE
ncbi:MFS general substrate transporter [Viridothelium virens]|uniref:MFS general substrate transporter n=1 Tax=Viridothelium virens TaxID=1048519 RepID=A0A6A6GY74_VIRVR|nr:MFS general substrate transporter [Viridothelium virens]